MRSVLKKYVLDTQIFIRAFRDEAANEALQEFHRVRAPFEYLSAVVAEELRAGIRNPKDLLLLERNVLAVYQRVGRVVTPSTNAWFRAGDVLAALRREEGLELERVSKSFSHDILLALSCRESGCVPVTENTRDFERIQRVVDFDFTQPWP